MSNNSIADAHDLKLRLEWGQPGFTIVDVRDRHSYNHGRISGAIPIPLGELGQRAKTAFHTERQIYVYGESDVQTAQAASTLRAAGYIAVSEIKGGLSAWKEVGGATEGVNA